MPALDEFGSQQCSELLRQLLDKGGWFDQRNLTWKVQHSLALCIDMTTYFTACRMLVVLKWLLLVAGKGGVMQPSVSVA